MTKPFDNKAHIRGKLAVSSAEWIRAEPEGEHVKDCLEYARVVGPDRATYYVLRNAAKPDVLLVFDQAEWDAFLAGVRAGEFDLPPLDEAAAIDAAYRNLVSLDEAGRRRALLHLATELGVDLPALLPPARRQGGRWSGFYESSSGA